MDEFGYEKLDVYRCAMQFMQRADTLIDKLPKGYCHLGDQLRRASLSISLNIAQGSAKRTRHRAYALPRDRSCLRC
jgi:four helix bundle protein